MRHFIIRLAQKFCGVPYIWGGNNPQVGFDCSGFVIWILQVFEILPAGDWTAQGLMEHFTDCIEPEPGDLVFYGKNVRATHVMMYIGKLNGENMCVGASGGDSTTATPTEAMIRHAMVKIKPVYYRTDFLRYGRIIT